MTEEFTAEYHAARGASFANTAEQYESARPGYPQHLLDEVFAELVFAEAAAGRSAPLRILDLGAGTGKLTRQLVGFGDVLAVEPLAEMREQLRRVLPDVPCLDGNAEHIPLADASVDVVTVGQAYHWFDQERANPEIWRVLADGGSVLALWNHEDHEAAGWTREVDQILGRDDAANHAWEPGWWRDLFVADGRFSTPELRLGAMTVPTTKQQLIDRCTSYSVLSILTAEERRPIIDEIVAAVASLPDPFETPYRTEAYWCRKLPPSAS